MVASIIQNGTHSFVKFVDSDGEYFFDIPVADVGKTEAEIITNVTLQYEALKYSLANPLPPTYQETRAIEYPNLQTGTVVSAGLPFYKGMDALPLVETFVDNYLYVIKYSDTPILPPDPTLKEGLILLETITVNSPEYLSLPFDKLESYKKAYNFRNLLISRYKIDILVGDQYDLIADLSKRLSMLTRLVIRVLHPMLTQTEMPEPYKSSYLGMMTDYITNVDAGNYYDRADLYQDQEMYVTLLERDIVIADIIKNDYLDKKI